MSGIMPIAFPMCLAGIVVSSSIVVLTRVATQRPVKYCTTTLFWTWAVRNEQQRLSCSPSLLSHHLDYLMQRI